MRPVVLFFVMLLITPLTDLAAQEAPPLTPGAKVRVSVNQQGRETGTLVALNADSLILRARGRNAPLAISLASVKRLEMSQGWVSRGERAWNGAGIGFLSGAAIGFTVTRGAEDINTVALCGTTGLLGALSGGIAVGLAGDEQREEVRVIKGAGIGFLSGAALGGILSFVFETRAEETVIFSGATGLLGALSGGIAAGLAGRERWEQVPLSVRVGVWPQRHGGMALSASFTF